MRNLILITALNFTGLALATPIATVYYDNLNNDTLNDASFSGNSATGIGDSITLSDPALDLTSAITQFYNEGLSSGTFDAILQFYEAGAPVGTPIGGSFTEAGIQIDANSEATVEFSLGGISLPQNVVFLLGVANATSGVDPGVELYSGVGPGSNTTDSLILLQGATFTQMASGVSGTGNPGLALESTTPEPGTWLLGAAGLGALGFARRRRAVRKQE